MQNKIVGGLLIILFLLSALVEGAYADTKAVHYVFEPEVITVALPKKVERCTTCVFVRPLIIVGRVKVQRKHTKTYYRTKLAGAIQTLKQVVSEITAPNVDDTIVASK